MALWSAQETVRDAADSLGINVGDDAARSMASDVEYRIHEVIQEAMRFMRHSKRTTMTTADISLALKVLNIEPMYGYSSSKRVHFREATLGPGQSSLWYLADQDNAGGNEEVDFERVINAPLPKVPRQVNLTAHWLAIEGVQPAIPQNPSERQLKQYNTPKGAMIDSRPGASSAARDQMLNSGAGETRGASISVSDGTEQVKPLLKHVLSKELLLYFERVTAALADETNTSLRSAAIASLRQDPGLHQLLPYFIDFISEQVIHHLRSISHLENMLHLAHALLENETIFIDPYIHSLVPPILTCLVAKKIGPPDSNEHYRLRDLAADLIGLLCRNFAPVYHTLKPRLVRTLVKAFLDNEKPLATHYGSIAGMSRMGPEVIRVLVVPNVAMYGTLLLRPGVDEFAKERNVDILTRALQTLDHDAQNVVQNMSASGVEEAVLQRLGPLVGQRILALDDIKLVNAILAGAKGI